MSRTSRLPYIDQAATPVFNPLEAVFITALSSQPYSNEINMTVSVMTEFVPF